jgi:hypothetical protein
MHSELLRILAKHVAIFTKMKYKFKSKNEIKKLSEPMQMCN